MYKWSTTQGCWVPHISQWKQQQREVVGENVFIKSKPIQGQMSPSSFWPKPWVLPSVHFHRAAEVNCQVKLMNRKNRLLCCKNKRNSLQVISLYLLAFTSLWSSMLLSFFSLSYGEHEANLYRIQLVSWWYFLLYFWEEA